ncbi:hypothetical protein [Streptomyces fradiae]|uniref:hypothetical protein n=1 Tax=Streptomyces fradiae TaxID=1906 RepID=UPI0037A33229
MSGADTAEYRIARLRDRLASEDIAELGVRIEERGGVALYGTVSGAACRGEVLRIAREELAGLALHEDLVVAGSDAPTRQEELS